MKKASEKPRKPTLRGATSVVKFDVRTFAARCRAFMNYCSGRTIKVKGKPRKIVWVDLRKGEAGVVAAAHETRGGG